MFTYCPGGAVSVLCVLCACPGGAAPLLPTSWLTGYPTYAYHPHWSHLQFHRCGQAAQQFAQVMPLPAPGPTQAELGIGNFDPPVHDITDRPVHAITNRPVHDITDQ